MNESSSCDQTILFSDIAGSTRLYEQLGDFQAHRLIATAVSRMRDIVQSSQGTVIRSIGDEVMCRFDAPETAARAAIRLQEAFGSDTEPTDRHIQLRIGLHYGSVIEEPDDLFGDAVNVAARIASQAKAGQILITRHCLDQMSADLIASARLIDQTHIKGKQALFEIFELLWGQPEELTMMEKSTAGLNIDTAIAETFMILDLDEKHIRINQEQPTVTLGRDIGNRIVINNPKVSRLHARIEMRRTKFFLVDSSTNGTYVLPQGGQMIHLRREEMPLDGEGLIGLGLEPVPDTPTVIKYYSLS